MRLALILTQNHWTIQSAALLLAEHAAKFGQLEVFFYQDAALLASNTLFESRLNALQKRWVALNQAHQVTLHVCVASALARGVTDQTNATRHSLGSEAGESNTLLSEFTLSGLGELHAMGERADKVVSL